MCELIKIQHNIYTMVLIIRNSLYYIQLYNLFIGISINGF